MNDKLYLMKAGEYYKIGVSKTPDARRRRLQTGCPNKIEIVQEIEIYDAYKVEFTLHDFYQDRRTHGEWFKNIDEHQFCRAVDFYEVYLDCKNGSVHSTFKEMFDDVDDEYLSVYFDIRENGKVTSSLDHLNNKSLVQNINAGIRELIKDSEAVG